MGIVLKLLLSRTDNNPHNVLVGLKQMYNADPDKATTYNKEYIQINEQPERRAQDGR
jgi:hypothetical protein